MWGCFCSKKAFHPIKTKMKETQAVSKKNQRQDKRVVFFLHLLLGEKPSSFVLTQKYPHKLCFHKVFGSKWVVHFKCNLGIPVFFHFSNSFFPLFLLQQNIQTFPHPTTRVRIEIDLNSLTNGDLWLRTCGDPAWDGSCCWCASQRIVASLVRSSPCRLGICTMRPGQRSLRTSQEWRSITQHLLSWRFSNSVLLRLLARCLQILFCWNWVVAGQWKRALFLKAFCKRMGAVFMFQLTFPRRCWTCRAKRSPSGLKITAVHGMYEQGIELISQRFATQPKLVIFLGCTGGNMDPDQRASSLQTWGLFSKVKIGFSLVSIYKDKETIELAYNDPTGVISKFNLNILTRLNREFNSAFVLRTLNIVRPTSATQTMLRWGFLQSGTWHKRYQDLVAQSHSRRAMDTHSELPQAHQDKDWCFGHLEWAARHQVLAVLPKSPLVEHAGTCWWTWLLTWWRSDRDGPQESFQTQTAKKKYSNSFLFCLTQWNQEDLEELKKDGLPFCKRQQLICTAELEKRKSCRVVSNSSKKFGLFGSSNLTNFSWKQKLVLLLFFASCFFLFFFFFLQTRILHHIFGTAGKKEVLWHKTGQGEREETKKSSKKNKSQLLLDRFDFKFNLYQIIF